MILESELLRFRLLQSAEGNLSGRDKIWSHLVPLIKENFLFGVGQTGYNYHSIITWGIVRSPHNVILEVICLTGFVGLIIYLLFLFNVFKRGFQAYEHQGLLLPILFGIPVAGLLLSGQILGQKIGWMIFAYIIGSTVIKLPQLSINIKNAHPLCN
jgi:O-antigen ligase